MFQPQIRPPNNNNRRNDNDDDEDVFVASPPQQQPLSMTLQYHRGIDDRQLNDDNNNDNNNNSNNNIHYSYRNDDDEDDPDLDNDATITSSVLRNMRYRYYDYNHDPHNPSLPPNIGLRERTTSQSSANDILYSYNNNNNSRDRTFSQNSVEQLEAQSNSIVTNPYHHLRRNMAGKVGNLSSSSSSSYKATTRGSMSTSSGMTPLLSSTTPLKYSSSLPTPHNKERLRSLIASIQSMQVPIWILRYYRNKQKQQQQQQQQQPGSLGKPTKVNVVPVPADGAVLGENNSNSLKSSPPLIASNELQQQQLHSKPDMDNDIHNNNNDPTVVYWIQGLDRVLFHKDTCCAQEIRLLGWKPPRYVWFALSGAICDILQLGMLYLLHEYVLPTNIDTSMSWMIAFCTSILFRHTTHRFFVFGTYVGGYTKSLIRIYMGYSVTIVLSTILNYILNRILAVNLFLLALLTMAWTGVVNYFILKYFWNFGSSNNNSKSTGAIATTGSNTSTGSNRTTTTPSGSSGSSSSSNKQSNHSDEMVDSQSFTAASVNSKS